jgi:leucyl aminopeptidase (aminopeptidase T)
MSRRNLVFVSVCSLAAILAAGGLFVAVNAAEGGVDTEALARKLVNECAGVREGEAVLISGGVRDLTLLEDIAVNVRKVGASPILTIYSDRMTKRMFDDVPAKYDTQAPELEMKLAGLFSAMISVEAGETEGLLAHVPAERMAARAKAGQPLGDLILQRGVRQVNLGNGLYPTADLAKRFGVPKEELAKIFWSGVNVDYKKLQTTGEAVKAALAAGKEAHITSPDGTDLRARIEGRPIFVSDGVISSEDVKKGGAACSTWLPAGEVYLTAVPGTAEGKVVVTRQFFRGGIIEGLTLTFKAGKLVSMTAKSGIEPLKGLYDASGEGKDAFGIIDLGINPNVKIVPGSRMEAWMPAGMVTVQMGGNQWAGGDSNSTFGLASFLTGATLKVDGKTIVEAGTLKM